MNFELSEDQILLRNMIRDFAEKEIRPQVKELEDRHEFPGAVIRKLGNLGILGMSIPAEFGGIKTDAIANVLVLEELSRISPTVCLIVSVHSSLFCYSILKYGTDRQKSAYLPPAATGNLLGAFSITEPGAGSDAMALTTKAQRQGDFYILNGTKAWVTSGTEAGALIIFAVTEKEPGLKKLSAFIVEKGFPGFRVAKVEKKMGLHSSPTAEVSLEDCRVPADNLLGGEGKGASIAFHCLDYSRIGIAAQAVGLSQRALEEGLNYARQRQAFGKKIAEFEAVQFMLADCATQLEAARLLTYRAADLFDRDKPFSKEAAMAKLYASEAANRIAYQALQIHGGYGYSSEFEIERIYRDARVLSIYEGTSEIQRLVIARSLLKESS
jgi:alkylation response protein AidB-like acyl-CoA dehydrogenase